MSYRKDAETRPPASMTTVLADRSVCAETPALHAGPLASTLPQPGTSFGNRYTLEALVNQGGMGAIYAARDERLGRKVAVKVMLDSVIRMPGSAERFEREARVAATINHPNCVAVYDYGRDDNGYFLVLEWVEGQTLADLVTRSGPLEPKRAAHLMAQVCDGLSAIHALGFVHRDVKPQNIMVTRNANGDEQVKLLDFGIVGAIGGGDARLTQPGFSLGSPQYMAPEQALVEPADATSDVYSAGATLFFVLSGRPPYLGDSLSVMQQLLHAEPPDAPVALLDYPLAAVAKQAMAKCRAMRPPGAAEFGKMIREAAASRTTNRSSDAVRARFPVALAAVVLITGSVLAMLGAPSRAR